jgi:preprotein translocase subunit Sec61beta
MQTVSNQIKKPAPLRVIFILNALMALLPFVFYQVFTSQNIRIGNLDPMWMVYTGIAYAVSFVVLVYFLANRKLLGARTIFLTNILIALPAGAYIGILVAIISLALSFFNQRVLAYFQYKTT